MDKYVVSISRQFGSLGRPIAKKLADLLNIEYYDRDIVEKAAEKLNLPVSEVSNVEEAAQNRFFMMKYPLGNGTTQVQDRLFMVQKQIILDLIDHGPCIIVGRCSDYILQGHKNHISVFIYAPYECRVRNCVESLGLDKETAKEMIINVDRARTAYHMAYAKFLPDDIVHKDILINSATMGIDGTANLLRNVVTDKMLK